MSTRETVQIRKSYWWHYDDDQYFSAPLLSKQELASLPAKYVVKNRPKCLTSTHSTSYVEFFTPSTIPKVCSDIYPQTTYGVLVQDYLDVLSNLPHYPNKKEAKELRRKRAKAKT